MPTIFGDYCQSPARKLILKRYRDELRKNLIIARVLEPETKEGWIVEHGNLSDLSVDEMLTSFDGFHAGRLLWPCTAYAEVQV